MREKSKNFILKRIREGIQKYSSFCMIDKKNIYLETENPFIEEKKLQNPDEIIEKFKSELEKVEGRCYICKNTAELEKSLKKTTSQLETKKILLSNGLFEEYELQKELLAKESNIEIISSTNIEEMSKADTGITQADYAIAESGTLVFFSSDKNLRSYSLVPRNHITFIKAKRIVDNIHTLFSILKRRHRTITDISSCLTFVTGPSRTADIELNLTLGVHGPEKVIVFVILQ